MSEYLGQSVLSLLISQSSAFALGEVIPKLGLIFTVLSKHFQRIKEYNFQYISRKNFSFCFQI